LDGVAMTVGTIIVCGLDRSRRISACRTRVFLALGKVV
jgi:hypothetical protein